MDASTWYEVIGYVGSGLIVLSLTMRSLLRLRVINLVGAAIFTVYGLLIQAPPVWVVNAAIVLIDVWELRRMLQVDEHLEVLEVRPDSAYLRRFLTFHAADIARFVPDFPGLRDDHRAFFVLRDLVPAAVVLARTEGSEAIVDLDYAIPAYRDLVSGRFVYRGSLFADLDVSTVVARGGPEHRTYLRRMGFSRDGDVWRLEDAGRDRPRA